MLCNVFERGNPLQSSSTLKTNVIYVWLFFDRNKGPRWSHCRKRDADGKVRSRDESETDAKDRRGSKRPEWWSIFHFCCYVCSKIPPTAYFFNLCWLLETESYKINTIHDLECFRYNDLNMNKTFIFALYCNCLKNVKLFVFLFLVQFHNSGEWRTRVENKRLGRGGGERWNAHQCSKRHGAVSCFYFTLLLRRLKQSLSTLHKNVFLFTKNLF